jgi:predicted choloylglycine hydrolase
MQSHLRLKDSSTSHKKYVRNKQSLVMILSTIALQVFSGSDYEIGVQQGHSVRELLHKALEDIPNVEAVKLMKPRLLPTSLFLALAKRRAVKLLKNDIFEYYPRQAKRLEGIVEGAEIDLSSVLLMQSMELLIGTPSFRLQGCTSLGFSPPRTSGETIVAKNFDYLNDLAPYHLTCETKPKEGYKTLGCKMAMLPGMLDCMNEYGLTVTYNLAYTTEKPNNFVPLSMALQEMLETCKSTDEAVKFIIQAKRGGHDALLMLADAEGNIKAVEIASNHAAVRETIDNQIINTNHYLTAEMQQYEIPHNAVYFGKVPRRLLGVRVHESSEQRLKRGQELLKGKAKIGEDKIVTILRDHGKDDKPSMFTICRHDEYASTLRSVIFHPNGKTIKVLYGNPCQSEYSEFTFS